MHTSHALSRADFEIAVDGRPAGIEAVLPGLDRLGIVVAADDPTYGTGASTLILAAVTAFYDRLRASETGFFAYPDYFAFHVGGRRASLRKLDIHPDHKEVAVDDDAEQLVRALNDRAITHLLVPDGRRPRGDISRETLHSARRRIRIALAYSPDGRVAAPDVEITASTAAEGFVTAMLGGPREGVINDDGQPTETFRRIPVDTALGVLESVAG